MWYFICEESKDWSPPGDWVYYMDDNVAEELRYYSPTETTVSQKYFTSFYTAVIFIKGNEIGPRTTNQIIICTLILLVDLIVAGNIFGSVAFLI